MQPRVGIIVAGMHRSGTSATARVVNLLGADITRDLMPAHAEINDRGFWESSKIVAIHDQLLAEFGSAWDDPMPLPSGWQESSFAQDARRRLAAEVAREFSGSRAFVTKDPRITRLLPLWLDLSADLGIEPVVVVPFRNPLEVANSLMKRDRIPIAKSILLFVTSYLNTELASRGRRRILVHYERLLEDWRPFSARLQQAAGASWPPARPGAADEIGDFLSAALRHNRSSRDELAALPDVAETAVEMYDRLTAAAESGDDASLSLPFDRLYARAAEATRLFQGLVATDRQKSRDTTAHVTRLNLALEAKATEAASLRARVAQLETDLAGLRRTEAAKAEELAAVHRSMSWRVTSPLRWVRNTILP